MRSAGEALDRDRRDFMLGRQLGLTKTYNLIHDPAVADIEVAHLRALHVAVDEAVCAAYGWDNLPLDHGHHDTRQGVRWTVSPAARLELLDRLLELNHSRYAEEQAASTASPVRRKRRGKSAAQPAEDSCSIPMRTHEHTAGGSHRTGRTDESASEPPESQDWTSRQVRAELERFLVRDLLGPWAGDTEELPAGTVPSERYILGVLSPARVPLDAEITDDTASDDGSGEGAAEVTAAAAAGSMAPASLGLSFSLPVEVSSVRVTASWGRYVQGESATEVTDAGVPRLVWRRVMAGGSVDLDVTEPDSTAVPDQEQPGVVVRARCRAQEKRRVVDVAIVNAQPEPPDRKDAAKIFQVRVEVTALDGNKAVFLPHNDPSHVIADNTTLMPDLEMQGLAMLYRQARQFAVGRNAGVEVDRRTPDGYAWRVATTNIPAYEVEQTVAPAPAEVPQLLGLEVDMRILATAPRSDVVAALRPLTDGYLDWLDRAGRTSRVRPDVDRTRRSPPAVT